MPPPTFDAAAFAAQLDALKAAGATTRELRQELADLTKQQLEDLEKLAPANSSLLAAIEGENSARTLLINTLERQQQIEEDRIQRMDVGIKKHQAQISLNEILIDQLRTRIRQEPALAAAHQAEIDRLEAINKSLDENIKRLEKQSAAIGDLTQSFSKLFSGSAPPAESLFSPRTLLTAGQGFVALFDSMENGAPSAAELKKMFEKAAIEAVLAYTDAIVKLTIQLADLENKFKASTGASDEMARSITTNYEELRQYTVTADDAAAGLASLYGTFTDFTMASSDQRDEHIQNIAVLGNLGVSHDTYAKSVQTATKALGVATSQGDDMMRGLVAHAKDLQVPVGQLTSEFAAMSPELAKLGDNAVGAFKDMARVAKITGFEMGKLLQMTNKFDTFEGAAEQAGKLNAALGGNFVNAMELMTATDPVERFTMIRDAISETGLSFDDMSYYQRKFYKDSLGLGSVAELAQVMSGDMESLDKDIGKTSADYEKMAKAAQTAASFQEKLNAAWIQIIPVLTGFMDGLSSIATWMTENAKTIKAVISVLLILMGVFTGGTTSVIGFALGGTMLADSFGVLGPLLKQIWAFFVGIWDTLSPLVGGIVWLAKMMWKLIDPVVKFIVETEILGGILKMIGRVIGVLLWPAMIALTAAFVAITWPVMKFIALGMLIYHVFKSIYDFFAVGASPSFIDVLDMLAAGWDMVRKAMAPIAAIVSGIGNAFSSAYGFVKGFFSDDVGAPNVLEGAAKLEHELTMMKTAAAEVKLVFQEVKSVILSMGEAIAHVLKPMTLMFSKMLEIVEVGGLKTLSEDFEAIAKSMRSIPLVTAFAMTTTFGAAAVASVAAAAAPAAAAAGGGGTGPIQVTLKLDAAATKELLDGRAIKAAGRVQDERTRNALFGFETMGPTPGAG